MRPVTPTAAPPVIFAAFANSQQDPLTAGLSSELNGVQAALRPLDASGRIKAVAVTNASIRDLFDAVGLYLQDISIFHYGGHAEKEGLVFEGAGAAEPGAAAGLAELFARMPRLALVFLNGCSTAPQVELLLRANVPAIIATTKPIRDDLAAACAGRFYACLAAGKRVAEALEIARAEVATRAGGGGATRGFGGAEAEASPETLWQLYPQTGPARDWMLPPLPIPAALSVPAPQPAGVASEPNAALTAKLADALLAAGGSPAARVTLAKEDAEANRDPRVLIEAVTKPFPLPVARQLLRVYARSELNADRLWELVRTYELTVQFLAFAMLAQLADALAARAPMAASPAVAPEDRDLLDAFLKLDETGVQGFDYFALARVALRALLALGVSPFMEETARLAEELGDTASTAAHAYLAPLRVKGADSVPIQDFPQACRDALLHVSEILSDLAFVALYAPTSIRAITVDKFRGQTPSFVHAGAPLEGPGAQLKELLSLPYENSTDSRSVIIQKNRKAYGAFLNLTPLIIDVNAFIGSAPEPRLYFYSCRAAGSPDRFVFRSADDPREQVTVPDAAAEPGSLAASLAPAAALCREFFAQMAA